MTGNPVKIEDIRINELYYQCIFSRALQYLYILYCIKDPSKIT